MTTSSSDQTIVHLRTHPKILVGPIVCELLLIGTHVLTSMYWSKLTGWGWEGFDQYSALIVHGALFVFNLLFAIVPALRWWAGTFTLTSSSVSQQWGVIMKRSSELPLDRIISVDTERGLLDRIFGCGTLVFQDASSSASSPRGAVMTRPGGRGSGIRFHDVPHVLAVRRLIDRARDGDSFEDE